MLPNEKQSLRRSAYRELSDTPRELLLLILHLLPEGTNRLDRRTQAYLAHRLGVRRQTVGEAYAVLEARQFVAREPRQLIQITKADGSKGVRSPEPDAFVVRTVPQRLQAIVDAHAAEAAAEAEALAGAVEVVTVPLMCGDRTSILLTAKEDKNLNAGTGDSTARALFLGSLAEAAAAQESLLTNKGEHEDAEPTAVTACGIRADAPATARSAEPIGTGFAGEREPMASRHDGIAGLDRHCSNARRDDRRHGVPRAILELDASGRPPASGDDGAGGRRSPHSRELAAPSRCFSPDRDGLPGLHWPSVSQIARRHSASGHQCAIAMPPV